MPTLNGRKDPAPHPGVDLATLRFARPTPTESPSTDSGLAGFPESSPQQIAPDTPASVLRARSCADPRAGLLGSRGIFNLGGWAGVARSTRWHRLSQEDPQSTRFIVARIGQCLEALAPQDSLQGRLRTSSPGRDPRATHPRSGSDPRAPPRQARRSVLEGQQTPWHRLASVDHRTGSGRPKTIT